MSLSKSYTSTPETTNTARLARLILGPCTDVLRDILKTEVHPSYLSRKVKEFTDKLRHGNRNPLNKTQLEIIFPKPTKQYSGDYSDLDISLLYLLLRNVSKISPHSKGWGEIPNPGDRSVAANIERIRQIRNQYYGHSADLSLSDSEFRQEWRQIRDIMVELERHLGTTTVYQDAVIMIKSCSMDPEEEKKYIDLLRDMRELHETIDNLSNTMQIIQRKYMLHHDPKVTKIETTKEMISKHSKALFPLFVRIRAVDRAKELLDTNGYVVIKGNPGTGKTTIAKILMKELMEKGKSPIQIYKITDLYGNISPSDGIVVFIDNLFGELSLSSNDVQEYTATSEMIKSFIKRDTNIASNSFIFTIRNDIYHDFVSQGNDDIFFKSSIIDLSNKANALQKEEILQLAYRYNISKYIDEKELISKISQMPISIGFPQCCKLAQNAATKDDVSALLLNPVMFLRDYFKSCIKNPTAKTAVLVYILLSGGQVEFEFVNNLHLDLEMKQASIELIGLHKSCINDFQESIDSYDGFLTVRDMIKNSITFSHSSVQESLFKVLFYLDPQKIIQNCHHSLLLTMTSKMPSSTQVVIGENVFHDVIQRITNIIASQSTEGYSSVSFLGLWNDSNFHKHVLNTKKCYLKLTVCHDMNGDSMIVHFSKAGNKEWVECLLNRVDKGQRYKSLNAACSRNHQEIVNLILSSDAECDLKTCFHAVQSGNLELLLQVCEFADLHQITYSLNPVWKSVKHSLLQEICLMRKTQFIEQLLQKHPFLVEIKDAQGSNALHSVASSGDKHAFNLLLNFGFDPYEKDRDNGHTVLTCACQDGKLDMVKFLIEKYPDLIRSHTDHQGKTLLYWAAFCGRISIFEYIVDLCEKEYAKENVTSSSRSSIKPDVFEKNKLGESILDAASSNGHYDMCEYLLNKYPQLLIDYDKNRGNALHSAAYGGNVRIFQYLTSKGLDIVSTADGGETVLHICCKMGRVDMFKYLNNKYPYLRHARDNEGLTVLHSACQGGSVEIVSFLLKQGLEIDTLANDGQSILHVACLHGKFEVTEYLIVEHPHLIDVKDKFSNSILHKAAFGGNVQIVRLLIKKGMDIYSVNKYGETILHKCSRRSETEMCEYLVNNYSDLLKERDNKGWTALHYASYFGTLDVLKFLIEKDIDITLKGNQGENVLHIACLGGNLNVCEFFMINYPELLYEKDFNGRTIIQYAADGDRWGLFQYLIDSGIDFSNGMNQSASTRNGTRTSTRNSDDSDLTSGEAEKYVVTCEKTFNKNSSAGTDKSDKSASEENKSSSCEEI